jgi:hypothetical protein
VFSEALFWCLSITDKILLSQTGETVEGKMMSAFWNIEPCSLVEVHRRFGGAYCLHHHCNGHSSHWWSQYAPLKRRSSLTRLHHKISQKAVIFILWNLISYRWQNKNVHMISDSRVWGDGVVFLVVWIVTTCRFVIGKWLWIPLVSRSTISYL